MTLRLASLLSTIRPPDANGVANVEQSIGGVIKDLGFLRGQQILGGHDAMPQEILDFQLVLRLGEVLEQQVQLLADAKPIDALVELVEVHVSQVYRRKLSMCVR